MIEQVEAIGFVKARRSHAEDDFWGGEEACIVLDQRFSSEALQGITDFSHVEVLYLFHEVAPSKVVMGARPNRIGSTICEVVRVEGVKPAWSHELMRQYWVKR